MSFEVWLAFSVAAALILIIPGPTIILVMSQAISHGRLSVLPLVLGVTLGDLTAMVLSLLGLGAIISTSAALFTLFKWAGAVYLLYLGIKILRSNPPTADVDISASYQKPVNHLKKAYIVTALNPKSIAFFVAFMPQFIDHSQAVFLQLFILGSTFLALAALNAAVYALFAGQFHHVMQNRGCFRLFNNLGGAALIGAGLITMTLKRT